MRKILLIILSILSITNIYSQKTVKMVEVAGGTFTIGSNSSEFKDENPPHEVTVSSFEISQYEIKFDNYSIFCKEKDKFEPSGTNQFPVSNVAWDDAVQFCNWLSEKKGLTPAYKIEMAGSKIKTVTCDFSADGYRLPTEAEWEYAARGGKRSKGYIYSGSNDATNVAWFVENYEDEDHKPGEKYPNELGIYDMTGNVAEWCWDTYDAGYFASSPKENPAGNGQNGDKVVKGGSKKNKLPEIEISRRNKLPQTKRSEFVGFRIVRTIK